MDQPGKVADCARGQLNRKIFFSCPCPRSRLGIWSRETGSAVPSRVSLLILHTRAESDWLVLTHGIPPDFRGGVHLFIPPTAIASVASLSGHEIAYRWCSLPRVRRHRASSPRGIVPVTGAAFSGIAMDQLMCASLFPHPLLLACSGYINSNIIACCVIQKASEAVYNAKLIEAPNTVPDQITHHSVPYRTVPYRTVPWRRKRQDRAGDRRRGPRP